MMIDPYGPPPDNIVTWTESGHKDSLQANQPITKTDFTAPNSTIVALVLSISLLCLSLAALTWGAVKLSDSVIALTQNAIQDRNMPAR
jgi:hypothetical protein